jgi:hypothetical protein
VRELKELVEWFREGSASRSSGHLFRIETPKMGK